MSTRTQDSVSSRFREFFLDQIKDIYWAEKHLSAALKKMKKAATSDELAEAFGKHHEDTLRHIASVEKVFGLLGQTPQAKKCDAMAGLISEAESMIDDTEKETYTRDAGLILAAQKAEHYEIATYGTLRIFAMLLGERGIERELEHILRNEEETDLLLTKLAKKHVNSLAVAE